MEDPEKHDPHAWARALHDCCRMHLVFLDAPSQEAREALEEALRHCLTTFPLPDPDPE